MNIDIGIKIHNRFDIEVKNIETGEIEHTGYAENIVLNSWIDALARGTSNPFSNIHFGSGNEEPVANNIKLTEHIGLRPKIEVEVVYKRPPEASFAKYKVSLLPAEYVGLTFREIGIGTANKDTGLLSHALIKDSVGNPLEIGPKTSLQEITFYATIFATFDLEDNVHLLFGRNHHSQEFRNDLLAHALSGERSVLSSTSSDYRPYLNFSSNKEPTTELNDYGNYFNTLNSLHIESRWRFTDSDVPAHQLSLGTGRLETTQGNGKIWSIVKYHVSGYYSNAFHSFRILLPNSSWQGYNFIGKAVGIGDGEALKFILPWSDINTTKIYKFYVDNELQIETTDYVLTNTVNETSILFTNPPANTLQITGDWWVDYIPKDTDHVLDFKFTLTYSPGA